MIGALVGDYVGSRFEFSGNLSKEFELIHKDCNFTDDSILTIALAKTILRGGNADEYAKVMIDFYRKYPNPKGYYGGSFKQWAIASDLKLAMGGSVASPYNSFGNGAAMRISPVAYIPDFDLPNFNSKGIVSSDLVAEEYTSVTHNHPEGVKGAQATKDAIILARCKCTKEGIIKSITDKYGYEILKPVEIRGVRAPDESCQETVPMALGCFFYSDSFEDAIRNACSLSGDADTLACITGSIAYEFYKGTSGACSKELARHVVGSLPPDLRELALLFIAKYNI